ncbi:MULTISPECIES: helix-turn-helix domain-containing protein [Leptospira]|uniref:DNA-binding helix-turn-helix protein n=1 Tax=Leptospira alexanderi serovar Manhao 3 str. L 60 TaxID=1049759 RepID=V6HZE6_9LEPT|nr:MULTISPECIES: helix-turn-helix domain-containing protein [Leptospira]EQA62891.1 DNA-binding helix-turn-helix protein [Leptospira alexanderi serovar Manhao 3 str. L 60]QDK29106.1 helix-turn-helix domain-containing protein [Leptospira weilii]
MTDPEVIKRLKIVFDYLKKELNLNQKNVASKFGVTDSAITRILKGQNALTNRVLTQFESIFGISKMWIVAGQGEMLLPDRDSNMDEDQILLRSINRRSGFRGLIKILLKLSDKNLAAIKALAEKLDPE